MASPVDPGLAELIAEIAAFAKGNYSGTAVFTLTVYEYIITLGQEIDFFWNRRVTGAVILFWLNRYLNIVVVTYQFLTTFITFSDEGCTITGQTIQSLLVIQLAIWAAFSTLRSFALSRSWIVAGAIFVFAMFPFGLNAYTLRVIIGANVPIFGCVPTAGQTLERSKQYTIASRTSLIAADTGVILVTWYTLYIRSGRNLRRLRERGSFSTVLLRDGTLYFLTLLVLNCLHLAFTLFSINAPFLFTSNIPLFTEPLTAVLVARFQLDLQATNSSSVDDACTLSEGGGRNDSLVFARVIGTIGGDLSTGSPEDLESSEFTGGTSTVATPHEASLRGKSPTQTGDDIVEVAR